jgi:hypothetical protein
MIAAGAARRRPARLSQRPRIGDIAMTVRSYKDPLTPVEAELRRRRRWGRILLVAVVLAVVAFLIYHYPANRPVTYTSEEENFKYGSIGSDIENGMPLLVINVLPRMFPEYLPEGAPHDYTAFGFVQEPGKQLPIGFSTRQRIISVVGLNCATCHTGVVRESEQSPPHVYLGMPANTVDLQAFFDFLFKCAADERFTPDNILAEIDKDQPVLGPDRIIYRFGITAMQAGLLRRKAQLDAFLSSEHPKFGPGRVDTFNPYKTNQFAAYYRDGVPEEERYGTVDFPSLWNQKIREGMHLHWDGNNTSVQERNFSASFGAGATRENVDIQQLARIKTWIDTLPSPAYPFAIDQTKLERGKLVYDKSCAQCHALGGQYVGQVVPLPEIGTDEHRLNSYTEKLASLQLSYGKGYSWEFKNFKKTNGYANSPLDGIWARAPYLHNGSVPTLWDLLTPAEKRNNNQNSFYIGHGVYDTKNVGFRTDVREIDGRKSFLLVLTDPGNSNKGHSGTLYGTDLSDEDKWALIEYLKTL